MQERPGGFKNIYIYTRAEGSQLNIWCVGNTNFTVHCDTSWCKSNQYPIWKAALTYISNSFEFELIHMWHVCLVSNMPLVKKSKMKQIGTNKEPSPKCSEFWRHNLNHYKSEWFSFAQIGIKGSTRSLKSLIHKKKLTLHQRC